ncbi:MAG: hypothetical protein ACTS6G_05780 [Candidatus Hodgkinia cicadicola]
MHQFNYNEVRVFLDVLFSTTATAYFTLASKGHVLHRFGPFRGSLSVQVSKATKISSISTA